LARTKGPTFVFRTRILSHDPVPPFWDDLGVHGAPYINTFIHEWDHDRNQGGKTRSPVILANFVLVDAETGGVLSKARLLYEPCDSAVGIAARGIYADQFHLVAISDVVRMVNNKD
jgi:hypothetical protein